jgi:signal transduction histidine kinase
VKVNILLVDDQPARLLTYEAILAELGHNLVRASSGREALKRLLNDEFAVVLLDVSMPDMDGFEVARLIHQHPRFAEMSIIFVTGVHISDLDQLKGYRLGAVDYVQVPPVPEILRSKVAVLVELYLKRRRLEELNEDLTRANAQLADANTALQAEKTRELERLNRTLQQANAGLAAANRSLQNEVRERERAEAALKEADRHKDEFLAMLAHELRNPLAPIQNATHLLRHEPLQDGQLQWAREVIERQLAQLKRLVDDLLDVSRITRGKINLQTQRVELAPLVARAVETVQPLIDERGHELTVGLPDRPLVVLGDPARLTQAIANVLTNAAKYTDAGGRISVTVAARGREVEVVVQDTGIGIPRDQLPLIFDLFTQLEEDRGMAQQGLGIGLALVRRLLQMHGGSIEARSEGPGKGSEFRIRLPLHGSADAGRGQEQEDAGKDFRRAAPRRILVADDNLDTRESLALLLSLEGHSVYTASDGQQTLERAEEYRPDVALLDIGMPGMDGYEVARRIRARPWGGRITLVALTGWGQDADRIRSHDAGFDSHLVKPVDLDKVINVLARTPAQPTQR